MLSKKSCYMRYSYDNICTISFLEFQARKNLVIIPAVKNIQKQNVQDINSEKTHINNQLGCQRVPLGCRSRLEEKDKKRDWWSANAGCNKKMLTNSKSM